MLNIHHVFIIKFLGLFLGTLFLASLASYITLKAIVLEYHEEHLKSSIALMALEHNTLERLDDFVTKAHRATGLRITVIDPNGNVIAESNTDKEQMENHAHRAEVMASDSQEFGVSIRYSKTLKTDFLYVAKRIELYHKPVTLRLSVSLERIMHNFYALWRNLLIIFAAMTLLAMAVSFKMSKHIRYDIAQITHYLDEISNKNYKAVIKTKYFNEFLQISLLLKNLVKKLASREKQKRKYTAKLRLINKQRNDILSAISHELKNPIASISGYAETLHDDPDIDQEIRTKFLQKILSNAQKMSDMLDRLSLSVKLEHNDLSMTPTHFDLNELLEEVVTNMSKTYQNRHIVYSGVSRNVYADRTMIELVIINLIDNALKYSEDDVLLTLKENRVIIQDFGIGIEKEEQEKITSKFYRVRKNSWDNSMGIGLAIVSYILKLHRSALCIESHLHEGSTFSFSIKKFKV